MEVSTGTTTVASSAQTQRFQDQRTPEKLQADVPAIVAPGPWIAFGTLPFGFAFDELHRFGALAQVPSWYRYGAAAALILLGGWYILRANMVFHRAETPFQPWRPARTIAAQDIYARTRNPMYQGFIMLVLGTAVLFRSDWSVLFMMPAAMLIHYGVVLREESYLERRFGDSYCSYMAAVPRYGWPFRLFGA